MMFDVPLRLGSLTLPNRVVLAPLAGVSDVPFRRICQELGAGLTYVEMLSATALLHRNRKTFEMMARHASEAVLGVQVTGSSAEEIARAVTLLDGEGFDAIDINMGCPVRKVVGSGCGSAILRDQNRVRDTILAARAATRRPLSIKYRLGFTRDDVNVESTTAHAVAGAVDMVTIHGRTRSESYATPVDLAGIARGVSVLAGGQLPCLGNGDVFGPDDALRMREVAGCDGVMVSRGALGNPWIFRQIQMGREENPSVEEWLDVVLRHLDYQDSHYAHARIATLTMRKHLLWYTAGFPGAKVARERLNRVEGLDEARTLVREFARAVPPGWVRFASGKPAETSFDPKYDMDRAHDRGVGEEGL